MTPYDRRLNPYINRMAQDMQIRKKWPTRMRIDTRNPR